MIYAQFYQKSAVSDELVEACGDRGVIVVDARQCMGVMKDLARYSCKQRGYRAFKLIQAENFNREGKDLTGLINVI